MSSLLQFVVCGCELWRFCHTKTSIKTASVWIFLSLILLEFILQPFLQFRQSLYFGHLHSWNWYVANSHLRSLKSSTSFTKISPKALKFRYGRWTQEFGWARSTHLCTKWFEKVCFLWKLISKGTFCFSVILFCRETPAPCGGSGLCFELGRCHLDWCLLTKSGGQCSSELKRLQCLSWAACFDFF